ncbi:helix-turn-helix DNA binding domain protein [Propionibacterium phage Ouroboros]|uniref:Helix-turn-helix DNA binding domain protein n=1 Tax=Propionibacterium phage Ouroboros TaxID=1655017 RepID=A0A0H4ISN1_9CAUD|nr:helix-turn-helix DNA binding domain protein [Propionibacterium phage Ouroboros]AKO60705.1 helix-turn-helix DNA binding domain protein [Propionibacterium phage Ouroboros]
MSRRPTKADLATTASWGWATDNHLRTLNRACTTIAAHYPAISADDLYQDSLLYIAVREQYHNLDNKHYTKMCYRVAKRLANKAIQHLDQPKPLSDIIHLADNQTSN